MKIYFFMWLILQIVGIGIVLRNQPSRVLKVMFVRILINIPIYIMAYKYIF